MSGLNPNAKIAKSTGVDLPVMYVYLAGRIAGNCMDKCTSWRKQIRDHYKNYKKVEYPIFNKVPLEPTILTEYHSYPIAFLDPLNSGESKTADALGLSSHLPANLIYSKDLLSVKQAHVVVANVEDYFEEGIEDLLDLDVENHPLQTTIEAEGFYRLKEAILNRRENFGTICEIAWTLYDQKPLILIVPEKRKHIYQKHPFASRASVIVTSVEQLLEEKWLQHLYKAMAGSTYE